MVSNNSIKNNKMIKILIVTYTTGLTGSIFMDITEKFMSKLGIVNGDYDSR